MVVWKQLPQNGDIPLARSSHQIVASPDGKQLFIFGGEHAPRKPIDNKVHSYNIETGDWKVLDTTGDIPCPRQAATMAIVGGTLYLFGGRTEAEESTSLNELHALGLGTLVWKQITSPNPPPQRNYHTMAAYNDQYLYVFGGCGQAGRLNDLWCYDTNTHKWTQLPTHNAIKGRGGAGLAVSNDSLWVVGGFSGQEMNDVFKYDLSTQAWDAVADGGEGLLPAKKSVFGIATHVHASQSSSSSSSCECQHVNHIIVFGGEVEASDQGHAGAGQFSNDLYCFDAQKQSWHNLQPTNGNDDDIKCPESRGWMAATSIPGRGVIIHGGVAESNDRLGDLWLLEF
jgi:N-acetylneuraminic acid mutarotase